MIETYPRIGDGVRRSGIIAVEEIASLTTDVAELA